MPTVYVRSHTGPLPSPGLRDPFRPAATRQTRSRRKWQVSIYVDDQAPFLTTITDPFTEEEYKAVFERYLGGSEGWRERLGGESEDARMEERIREYGGRLWGELGLRAGLFSGDDTTVQIYVVEYHDGNDREGGVHCLAWELLESVQIPRMPNLRLLTTRISHFPPSLHNSPSPPLTQTLSSAQRDPNATIRILLVIARDFSRAGPEPDLAQWPLMSVRKRLGPGRMMLEVVRPGSVEALEGHLRRRARGGVFFHLVHFDVHGRVRRDENGHDTPWLLFAKHRSDNSAPQTNLTKASSITPLLHKYHIENVVLNACLSAYNPSSSATNLAHTFLEQGGVRNVSAMWFYVHWRTAAHYLDVFYGELLVKGRRFHDAVQRGREALRCSGRGLDYFLCVNYTREEGPGRLHERPAVSYLGDSSTSLGPMRSLMGRLGRSSTPNLVNERRTINDDSIMRLKLHLLELEYKLTTFGAVYASDLRRTGSDLEGTIARMVDAWLATNFVGEVRCYDAGDFAKRRALLGEVPVREKRTRGPDGCHRHARALRPTTLHVILRGVDEMLDPGRQASERENQRNERRGRLAQAGLRRFARGLRREGRSFVLVLGSQDKQWWGWHLRRVGGCWWVDVPWHVRVRGRHD